MRIYAIKFVFVIIITCSFLLPVFSQTPDFYFTHKNRIELLLFSPDGKLLGAEDAFSFNIYEVISGRQRGKLDIKGFANSAIFSNDGKFIITGNNYGEVSIYETASLTLVKTFPITHWSIYSLAISPDNHNLAIDIGDGTIEIRNVKNGEKIKTLGEKGLRMKFMTFSPNEKLLVSTKLDSQITIWNLETAEKSISQSNYSQFPPVFCELGTELAISNLREVKFINVKSGEILRTISIPEENIPFTAHSFGGAFHGNLVFSNDCKTITINNYKTKMITILDAGTRKVKQTIDYSESKRSSYMIDFSPSTNAVASGTTTGEVKVWRIK